MEYKIVALKIGNRDGTALDVQRILTEYGCNIKVRLGLHDVQADSCSPAGLVLMEVIGDDKELEGFAKRLNGVPEVSAKFMKI
jgi:hypothetical protein